MTLNTVTDYLHATPRRALIGNAVYTADGSVWKVTGIDANGTARLALNGIYRDVPQDMIAWTGNRYALIEKETCQ